MNTATRKVLCFTLLLMLMRPLYAAILPGDSSFLKRADPNEARAALETYRKTYAADPGNPENGWRLSMACYFVGLRLTEGDSDKREIFSEGRDAGLSSLVAAPECAACHFWTAINMALYGQSAGALKLLLTIKEIRGHLDHSIKIDPTYAYGGAYRLLGLIDQKLPGFLGGDAERSFGYFRRAIELSPDEPLNYLFLAKLYLEKRKDERAAGLTIAKGLSLPAPAEERVESREALAHLHKLALELKPGMLPATDTAKTIERVTASLQD